MERHETAIIIPAYNEAKTIKQVTASVIKLGRVIVVDDGSIDKTAEEAAKAGAVVVVHDVNKGYDEALNSGFIKAAEIGAEKIITFDADGQHEPEIIDKFVKELENNDIVLGVRPKKARIAEKVFAFYTDIFWGIKDPLCGMKGYKTTLFKEQGFFDNCKSIGSQLAVFAAVNKKKTVQIKIPVYDRVDKPRFGSVINANIKIFKALFSLIKAVKKY